MLNDSRFHLSLFHVTSNSDLRAFTKMIHGEYEVYSVSLYTDVAIKSRDRWYLSARLYAIQTRSIVSVSGCDGSQIHLVLASRTHFFSFFLFFHGVRFSLPTKSRTWIFHSICFRLNLLNLCIDKVDQLKQPRDSFVVVLDINSNKKVLNV